MGLFDVFKKEKENMNKVKEHFQINGMVEKSNFSAHYPAFQNAYTILKENENIVGWEIAEHKDLKGVFIVTDSRILFSGAKLGNVLSRKLGYDSLKSIEVEGIVNKTIKLQDDKHEYEFELKTYKKTTEQTLSYIRERIF